MFWIAGTNGKKCVRQWDEGAKMHQLAKEWDKKYSRDPHRVLNVDGKLTPVNRPCDWCGKRTVSGYIHTECAEKERNMWLDIID